MTRPVARIFVVEGETLARELLLRWLESQFPDAEVTGHAGCLTFLTDPAMTHDGVDDVVIANAALPDGDCFDLLAGIVARRSSPLGIVVLGVGPSSTFFDRMTRTAVAGWALLGSSTSLAALDQAISAVRHGMVMVDPSLRAMQRADGDGVALSEAETQVMDLVAKGCSNATIAEEVFLSEKSVERILGNVYQKFGIDRGSRTTNARVRACLIHLGIVAAGQATPKSATKR